MLGMLLIVAFIIMAGIYISKNESYGNKLEEYINSKNPTNIADVEKFEREFQEKNFRSIL